ncbi:hypothetical protein IEQ34_022777 [Dendrobium chrysotoxum]|uniref:Uncharacterized protein n=1 Tax=Dendrobium chrysotoxum TaxID=161865 RepID=A0AAV7FYN8_DENCH|nr:hypothetical protein IEQ34_022777 [Dendrobium chrysotoxum]
MFYVEVKNGWIFQHAILLRIGPANDWSLSKKWGSLKELLDFPHLGEEEILKTLNFSNMKSLQEDMCWRKKLFKVGLSIQAGRSHAVQLKKSKKVLEISPNALRSLSNNPSRGQGENGSSLVKKRRVNDSVGFPSDGEVYRGHSPFKDR